MQSKLQMWKRRGAGLMAALVFATGLAWGGSPVLAQTTPQQALEQLQLEDAVAGLAEGAASYTKQGHQALTVHDRLLDAVDPGEGSGAYDAFVEGTADSAGYAQAMALLLDQVKLENCLVTDPATGETWNRVQIDSVWYNLSAYRDDLSGNRTAFLKSDEAFSLLLGSDPSCWTGEHPCTDFRYDDWFLNQSRDGGDVWKSNIYYTDGNGTLYAGYLMGSASSSNLYREETGLSRVDACAAFDGSLYLVGSQQGGSQGLYRYNGSYNVTISPGNAMVREGSVTAMEQDIGEEEILSMYATSTGLVLQNAQGEKVEITLHTHTLGDWQTVQQMDCAANQPGKEVRSCTLCKEQVQVRYEIPEHHYSQWQVVENPTPEQEGSIQQVCQTCHQTISGSLLYGDVDFNGKREVLDVMMLAQIVVGVSRAPEGLDCNYSGDESQRTDILDVMALAQYLVSN